MGLYSISILAAEKKNGRWRHRSSGFQRHLDMGPAGVMLDAAKRLSRVLGRDVSSKLEGDGILLAPDQLEAYLRSAKNPDRKLLDWVVRLDRSRRFFVCAVEI